jgi:hypothetical protein
MLTGETWINEVNMYLKNPTFIQCFQLLINKKHGMVVHALLFFAAPGFELRASHLLGRHSTISSALFCDKVYETGSRELFSCGWL